MAKNHKYIQKRKDRYGIRVPVPKHLQEVLGNQKEITRSFGTKVREQAEKLYPEYLAKIQRVFDEAEAKLQSTTQTTLAGLNVLGVVTKWHHLRRSEIMARTKAMFTDGTEEEDYKNRLRTELVELSSSDINRRYHLVESTAHGILADEGYPFDGKTMRPKFDMSDIRYHDLFEHLIASMIELKETELSRLGELISFTPNGDLFRLTHNSPVIENQGGTQLEKLIADFMDVRGNFGKSKTVRDKKAAFEYLLKLVGPNFFVEALERNHFLKIRTILEAYPLNANKINDLKGLTLSERSAFAKKYSLPLMSKQNANKIIARLKALMHFAVSSGIISHNPCLDLEFKISHAEKQKSEKKPFTIDQLNKLFSTSAFKANYPNGSAMYWAPLIALFHGLRMEEILLLTLDEIKCSDDGKITYFDLTNFTTEQLKNANAIRRVPIHEELIRLGFLEYLALCNKHKGKRLFPELKRANGEDTTYRKNFSRDFSRYLKKEGIKTTHVVFHSFRRNFSVACTNGEIPNDIENALGGWSLTGGQGGTYKKPKDISISKLKEMIDRVKYPGLELSHLYI